MDDYEFYLKVMELFSFDYCEELFWRTDGEYAPLSIFVTCGDFFHFATADVEQITKENLPILIQAKKDVDELVDPYDAHWFSSLFAARVRKTKPLAYYLGEQSHIPNVLIPLFEAAGDTQCAC